MSQDMRARQLDRILGDLFRPEPAPPGFARRIVAEAAALGRQADRLLARLSVRATARGVTLIRPGRHDVAESAAARRVAERARLELGEYLAGKRAFFSVPVILPISSDTFCNC